MVCPQKAIQRNNEQYTIAAHRCNECEAHYEQPQCSSICPVENAIIDAKGVPLNPTLSLTPTSNVLTSIQKQQRNSEHSTG